MYFDKPGKENTRQTLELACARARELGITELVLASTGGETALLALEICNAMQITSVSYHAGFHQPFKLSISDEARLDLESKGVRVICATHALSGVERGLAKKIPGSYPLEIVARTLKLFGQGVKVAVEVSIMAADAGALSGEKIIAVGGSSKGADTALVLSPASQSNFLEMKIHEIICKPNLFD